jgi:aminopeptidase
MDIRAMKFAQILVDHSAQVKPGERVAITSTPLATPVLQALYELVLDRGAYPHLLLDLPGQDEILFAHASDELLDFVPLFHQMAFEQFDVLFKIRAESNTRLLSNIPPARVSRRQKATASLIETQMRRGADKSLRWMSTQYPTNAYAMEAEMGLEEYQDFFFRACHADEGTPDPVGYWKGIKNEQAKIIAQIEGHDQVQLRGPHVDLTLSIKGRRFVNACGQQNLPDGEIYTGPVEDSANGWVHYTFPAVYGGRVVEGIELVFEKGKVVNASARQNQDYLLEMLETDPGAKFIGEFAIGTNYGIDRFTRSILLDEKIGGSFHMALGAGYPETGSTNRSRLHWDMICDLRHDSEILLDGELLYKNGKFVSN